MSCLSAPPLVSSLHIKCSLGILFHNASLLYMVYKLFSGWYNSVLLVFVLGWVFFFIFTLPFQIFCSLCMLLTWNYDRPDIVFICLQLLLKLCILYVWFVLAICLYCFYYDGTGVFIILKIIVTNSAFSSWSCSMIKDSTIIDLMNLLLYTLKVVSLLTQHRW